MASEQLNWCWNIYCRVLTLWTRIYTLAIPQARNTATSQKPCFKSPGTAHVHSHQKHYATARSQFDWYIERQFKVWCSKRKYTVGKRNHTFRSAGRVKIPQTRLKKDRLQSQVVLHPILSPYLWRECTVPCSSILLWLYCAWLRSLAPPV